MKFIIGSTNKAKVRAAMEVITLHFPQISVSSIEIDSGVSNQPFGDEETRRGAINRALHSSESEMGAIGIGLEGGVRMLEGQMYLCNWGAVVLPDGTCFTAAGAQIPLPEEIATKLLNGKELGPVMDQIFKISGLRQNEGAIGILTAKMVSRHDLFVHICHLLIGQLLYSQER